MAEAEGVAVRRFQPVRRLFLDTAPVIYFTERNEKYFAAVSWVMDRVDRGDVVAVTSPVTLAECVVHSYRAGEPGAAELFQELIVRGKNTAFVHINDEIAHRAARVRASSGPHLLDALQVAVASHAGCDALLTNNATLRRILEPDVIVLDDIL